MKKKLKIYFATLLCALLMSPALISQNQMFAVQMNKIKFDKGKQTVEAMKKANELIKTDSKNPVYYNTYITTNNTIMSVAPIQSFASLDKMSADIGANNKLVGAELGQQFAEGVTTNHTSIVLLRNDLSRLPVEGTDLSDMRYIRWTHHYFNPKDGAKMVALVKKVQAWSEKQNPAAFYFIYQPIFGADTNRIIAVHLAKNPTDLAALDASGPAPDSEIIQEYNKVATDVRMEYGWYRPDLSLLPEAVPQEK